MRDVYQDINMHNNRIINVLLEDAQSRYIFNQAMPSSQWVITHNLNCYPSVTIVNTAGDTVLGNVKYIDSNTVRLDFAAPFSGNCYVN